MKSRTACVIFAFLGVAFAFLSATGNGYPSDAVAIGCLVIGSFGGFAFFYCCAKWFLERCEEYDVTFKWLHDG